MWKLFYHFFNDNQGSKVFATFDSVEQAEAALQEWKKNRTWEALGNGTIAYGIEPVRD
jgi:hypothetical protein